MSENLIMEQQDRVSPLSYPGAYLPQEDDGVSSFYWKYLISTFAPTASKLCYEGFEPSSLLDP